MGVFMHDDICEQIFVRLDVEDLIRCKSVCKSWKSLIRHPLFVKAHHRRQVNRIPYNYLSKYGLDHYMVGSSNGLVCINSFDGDEIIVANPWTREERMLQKPPVCSPNRSCWGFGYDALTDDYKVVFGAMETFYVLSLKSNAWKHVGHVNNTFSEAVHIGTLCNGALHWVKYEYHRFIKGLVISFDLSEEVIKEIDQPDDAIRECRFLAIKDDWPVSHEYGKKRHFNRYNVKRCWENMGCNCILGVESIDTYTFIPTTVMPSLTSPHLQEGN